VKHRLLNYLYLTLIIIILSGCSKIIYSNIYKTNVDGYTPKYEVNSPNWSDNELLKYYANNNIFPATIENGVGDKLFDIDVSNHLSERFSEYTNWHKLSSNSVSSIYFGNPIESNECNYIIQSAKSLANITSTAIGCGPLAMLTQFDYLARYAGYSSISRDLDIAYNKMMLAKEIFERTPTIPAESPLGQFFGVDPNDGTFTFPYNMINTSREMLKDRGLAIEKNQVREDGSTYNYYDRDSQIYVYGDSIPSILLFGTKINNLIDSIDNGMPVIWWTTGDAGNFSNHYMNIFGYEYWIGTDDFGNTLTHLMFKLRYNWGIDDVYMDSDTLDAVNGGFIFFEETHEKALFVKECYDFWECQYFFDERQSYILSVLSNKYAYTNRLRTGYINHYDSTNSYVDNQYLTLSAKRNGAGVAYIEYTFDTPVEHIFLYARWWGSNEGITASSGSVLIQYLDSSNNWVTAFDLLDGLLYQQLPTIEDMLTGVSCRFNEPTYTFRIYVSTNYPNGSSNKGRLVIEEMNVFFSNED